MKIIIFAMLAMYQAPGQPSASRAAYCLGQSYDEFNKCMAGSNDLAKAELCESRKQIKFNWCMQLPGEIPD